MRLGEVVKQSYTMSNVFQHHEYVLIITFQLSSIAGVGNDTIEIDWGKW